MRATLIDTRSLNIPRERLDPLLVSDVESENLGWGMKELEAEIRLYPGGVDSAQKTEPLNSQAMVHTVHRVWEVRAGSKMMMEVYAKFPSGRGQMLNILIDAGAEVNLVR